MGKQYICTRGWKRDSAGVIIDEWTWKKYPQEIQENNFKLFEPEPVAEVVTVAEPEPVVELPPTPFERDLTEKLSKSGIKAEFKHKLKDGTPTLDATFKFENETKNNI